jgi:hypothetical protein
MVKEIKDREEINNRAQNNSVGRSAGLIPNHNITVFSTG